MQERYESKARKIRSVLAQLGLKLDAATERDRRPVRSGEAAAGKPSFERALIRVNVARAYADGSSSTLVTVPVRKPVTGEIDVSSPFGVRIDPFVHVAAMHTGLDFRGDIGEPIHATAAGTVTIAGWSGGYGKMVEIDHGNGLATRYGHMSEIDVRVGEKSGSARSSAGSARPAARPARICITRRASTARRSIRQNSLPAPLAHHKPCLGATLRDSRPAYIAPSAFDLCRAARRASPTRRPRPRRRGAERLLRQRRFRELIDVAVEHAGGVGGRDAGAQVLHHLIGLQHVGADLVAPADVGLGGLIGGGFFFALLQFELIELGAQHLPGLSAVAMLRAVVLAHHRDVGRDVGETDRRFGLVDVLAAGAAGAHACRRARRLP